MNTPGDGWTGFWIKKAAVLVGAVLYLTATLSASADVTFAIRGANGVTNSQVVIPIATTNFSNISGFQFSFHWNPAVASFVGIEQFGLPNFNTTNNFGTRLTTNGTLTVSWEDPDGASKSLPDSSTLFAVRLRLIGAPAAFAPLTIDGTPTSILAADGNLSPVAVTIVNARLSIDHTLLYACPTNRTVECGSNWTFDQPIVTDTCTGNPASASLRILSTTTNLTSDCQWTATRSWEITDPCNNRAVCSQTIYVMDTRPPQVVCSQNKSVEYGQTWTFDPPQATDDCSGTDVYIGPASTVTNASLCGKAFSVTRVFNITDPCGNTVQCSQTVNVRDTIPPTLTCPPRKDINCLAPWDFDAPTAVDIPAGGVVLITVLSTVTNGSCGEGFTATRTWQATDECGNTATCSQTVAGRALVTLTGNVYAATNYPHGGTGVPVPGVTLSGPVSATTGIDGGYSMTFDAASNVVITPAPPASNAADAITTVDIALIRRHILSVSPLDSPYRLLAADVDGSRSVSTLDLAFMRRVILGVTNRFPVGVWRFAPAAFTFPDVLAPWDAPAARTYSSVLNDAGKQDFVAIKLGDVNSSWAPTTQPATAKEKTPDAQAALPKAGAVTFTIGSGSGLPGSEIVVPVRVSGFSNVVGFQFSFHWNPAVVTFAGFEQFGLPFTASMYNTAMTNNGVFTVAWNDETGGSTTVPNATAILSARFKLTGSPEAISALQINGTPTAFEVGVDDGSGIPQVLPASASSGQLTILQPNRSPILGNVVNRVVSEGSPLTFTASVTDPDPGQSHTFSLDPGAPAGANLNPNTGAFSWTPTESQGPGVYSITIRVADNGSPSLADTRTMSVTVNEVNVAPTAASDSYSVNEDQTLVVAAPGPLANDTDIDGNTLSAVLVSGPAHGTLTLSPNGSFSYTPASNYRGSDSFTYRAHDGQANSGIATVTFTIMSGNDAPSAAADNYSVNEDTTLVIGAPGLLANDADIDGDNLSVTLVSGPSRGTMTLQANGAFTYRPGTNFNGADSFTYRATDGQASSGTATVTITVTPVNDRPVLANIGERRVLRGATVTFTASAIDADVPGQLLTFSIENGPSGAAIDPATGFFTWAADIAGPSTNYVTIRVADNASPSLSDTKMVALIVDEDVFVAITDAVVPGGTDGNLQATFDVTLSAPFSQPVSVDYRTVDGTAVASIDYTPVSGTMVFAPGVTHQSIQVTVVGSSSIHTNRTFLLQLTSVTNARLSRAEAEGLITAEPAVGISVTDISIQEPTSGMANATFNVLLWPPSETPVSVKYTARKRSALAGKDFKAKKGILRFSPGTTNLFVNIPVTADLLSETNEIFTINLTRSVNAVIATPVAAAEIVDSSALPNLTIHHASATETDSGVRLLTFLVQLSAKSGRFVSVDYTTADETALADQDYALTSGTLVFAPGATLRKVTVPIYADNEVEGSEVFLMNLSNAVNAEIINGQAVGTIRDDDTPAARR